MQLDDWVLCRIYKKNSSAQKAIPNGIVSSREYTQYSNDSSASSSSHLDDVLQSLPEIDDRCFMLPRVNSLRTMQHRQEEDKLNLLNLNNNNLMDWSNPSSILNTEFQEGQNNGMVNYSSCNDLYVPSVSTICHVNTSGTEKKPMEEEVQSGGARTNPGLFERGSNNFTYSNSVDSFGFRYPVQPVGFGFGQ